MHKYYTRIDKFDGSTATWKEWHYQFEVATGTYDQKTAAVMGKIERMELPEATTDHIMVELEDEEENWVDSTKAGLFGVLGMLTTGEANFLVRSCEDKNGYTAWKKLYDRYNPKTPASLTAAWREVIRLKKAKDVREAGKNIDVWEGKIAALKKEHGEEPTAGLKASLLLEMLPEGAQMTVLQGMNAKKLDFEALKSKIKMMASIQTDNATPKPMDIGETHDDWGEGDWGEGVEAVGAQKGKGKGPAYGSCWTCGGPHFSRDCPKGSSKGQKASGKGEQKGKGKGKSSGPMFGSCWTCGGAHFANECPKGGGTKGAVKGKGKSLRCGTCGGTGHRAEQCPSAVREVEEAAQEGEHEELGSVSEGWDIFGLEEHGARRRQTGRLGRWSRGPPKAVMTRNRFELLAEVDEEDPLEPERLRGTLAQHSSGQDAWETFQPQVGGLPASSVTSVPPGVRLAREVVDGDWIQWCAEEGDWHAPSKGEIVVDSGAAESVCPWDWANQFPVREVPWDCKRNFLNASGGRMEHYGEKKVRCGFAGSRTPVNMTFQVSDARNPLASVARITENGNIVQFGPKDSDNYVFNPTTEEKIMMRRKGRKFVLDVDFLGVKSSFTRQA